MEAKPLPRVFRTADGPCIEVSERSAKGIVTHSYSLTTLCRDSDSAELIYDAIDQLLDALAAKEALHG